MMEYDHAAKALERGGVMGLQTQSPNRPILYLDGANGEATDAFMTLFHANPAHLVPVNSDASVIAAIQTKHPQVQGRTGDINAIVTQSASDAFAAVWLDYTCRYNDCVHDDVFREALRVAPFASLTFSTRGVNKQKVVSALSKKIKKVGKIVVNVHSCKGKSKIENMIKLTIGRKDTEETQCSPTPIDVPAPFEQYHEGDKVLVGYGLTAVVCNDEGGSAVWVRFDCDAEQRCVEKATVSLLPVITDRTPLAGADLMIPIKVFRDGLRGYETTKRTKRCLHFTVGKRHRNSPRFTVHAVTFDDTMYKKAEQWTVTAEQIRCWKC
jgi:hypothetical protein